MLICLDYDNTYTADPELWNEFISNAQLRGHSVIVATMRYPREGKMVEVDLQDRVDQIIFTNRKAKKPYLADMGIHPNIWIDDIPEFLLGDG